jgi:tetratricopeptide (TPR) repeat protein
MIGYRHLITVGLIAFIVGQELASCPEAHGATARPATTETQPAAADLPDRVTHVEGRLDGIEEATKRAAAAGEHAAKASAEAARSSQEVIATIGECTKFITGLIAVIGVVLGFFGYRELKTVEAVRKRAEEALGKTEEAGKAAQDLVQIMGNMRKQAEADIAAATKVEPKMKPMKERSPEEKEVLQDASRAADRLEDLGQELTPEAWVARGIRYVDRKEYGLALEAYDQALKLRPEYTQAHLFRGGELFRVGRREEAFEAYDRAIELAPNYADARYYRACAHALDENRDETLRDLKKTIELDESYRLRAQREEFLAYVREDPEFKQLVELDKEGGEEE